MTVTYNKKIVFFAACLAIFLFGASIISLGTFLPFITTNLGLNEMSKGILASVLPLGILAGSLTFGPVIDRYGYRYLLFFSVLSLFTGFIFVTWSESFNLLATAFFFLGMGGGILNGVANALVSSLSEDSGENKAANLSVMGVFYGIGALGMPSILALLIRQFQFNVVIAGIGWTMVIPMIFFFVIKYPSSGNDNKISIRNWMLLLGTPLMLLIGMVGFFQSGLESLVNNWVTSYLTGTIGINEKQALFTLTLFVAVFTLTRLILGIILRKINPVLVLTTSMAIVITGIFILIMSKDPGYTNVAVILFGLGLASTFPIITGHTGDLFKSQPGTAMSILFTLSLIGNMSINYATGWFTSHMGMKSYPLIFMMAAIFTLFYVGIFYRYLKKINNL